jgi:alkyl sulfatase BDS1-like metallo-beta-lactamase superfamily hydrolase
MTEDAVTAFFEDLGSRGYDPLLRSVSATVRFDLMSGKKTTERWLLTIEKGDLSVSHRNIRADAVIQLSRDLFERVARGETTLLPAMLRGEVVLEGDYKLMIMIRRLLRTRLTVRRREAAAGYARRQQ